MELPDYLRQLANKIEAGKLLIASTSSKKNYKPSNDLGEIGPMYIDKDILELKLVFYDNE